MIGQKHFISCRCFLHQFRNLDDPPIYEFSVFSVIDNDDNVITKFAQCPNCKIIHKIVDICKSEIVHREHLTSIISVNDIKCSLDEKLIGILEQYEVDLSTWEQAKFIIDNEEWGSFISLTKEFESGLCQGKYLKILKKGIYSIESYARDEIISI